MCSLVGDVEITASAGHMTFRALTEVLVEEENNDMDSCGTRLSW